MIEIKEKLMFDRVAYKRAAWRQFSGRMGAPVVAGLLPYAYGMVMGPVWLAMGAAEATWLTPVAVLLMLSATGVCQTATSYVALKMTRTEEQLPVRDVAIGVKDYWQDGILGILWAGLWTALWSLLFIVPGIVKAVSYSMVYFVLVENPGIGVRKALDISKIMTEGHKADLFVMSLSFLGWSLLAQLTGGIGYILLVPYQTISFANAYNDLKSMALRSGRLTAADFSA